MTVRYLTVVLVSLLGLLIAPAVHAQDTLYVDPDATGSPIDGQAWNTAYRSLTTGINNSTSGDEIWVAEGVYKPGSDPVLSYELVEDSVEIYGGFEATESVRDNRAPSTNLTILSGDADANDETTANGITPNTTAINGENSNTIFLLDGANGDNITRSTVIDGVIFTAGQAAGTDGSTGQGGALFCRGSNPGNSCNPTLRNVRFRGNAANQNGGAVYNSGFEGGESSPLFVNTIFSKNGTNGNGGAVYNDGFGGTSSPVFVNPVFAGNRAASGGALFNLGEGSGASSPEIVNGTISANAATNGGGALYNTGNSAPRVVNTILWDNAAPDGAEILNDATTSAAAELAHTIIQGGVNGSGVAGNDNTDAGANLNENPLFAGGSTLAGEDGTLATVDDSLNLRPESPAFDAGDNSETFTSTDVTGAVRIQDLNGDGTATVNIGAHESIDPLSPFLSVGTFAVATGASLTYRLNPAGSPTTVQLRLAPTSAPNQDTLIYDQTIPGAVTQSVGTTVRALEPNTTYEVTAQASNAEGTFVQGPTEIATPPAPALRADGGDQTVSVRLSAGGEGVIAPQSAVLYARIGGRNDYQALALESTGDATFEATIPASLITPSGVDYYTAFSTDNDQITIPTGGASAAQQAPLHLPVSFNTLAVEGTFRAESYRMVSVPARDTDVKSALTSAYGPYAPSKWRVLQWKTSTDDYREFPNLSDEAFDPGTAFWLITADGSGFSIGKGTTVDASSAKTIQLDPGWTQVGNPYGFSVPWDSVEAASTLSELDLDGPFVYRDDKFKVASALRPWAGYFVFNATSESQSLTVPPTSGATPATANPAALGKTTANASEGASAPYTLTVTAQTNDHAQSVWMGLRDEATAGRDRFDVAQPPLVTGDVRLSVMETIGERAVPHAESFKPTGGKGHTWRLVLSGAADTPTSVRLDLTSTGRLPEGQEQYIVDPKRKARVAPGEELQLGKGERRVLKVIVGEKNYAERKSEGITRLGYADDLQNNYPNPFREATTLRYSLSEKRPVTLEVYNVLGQRVRTLVNEKKEAGVHQVQWNGTNRYGEAVSSGVYFVQLRAGPVQKTQKVVRVR